LIRFPGMRIALHDVARFQGRPVVLTVLKAGSGRKRLEP
jgi:hypothetical protein